MSEITNNKIGKYSFLSALGEVAYVCLVALVMSNGERIFGGGDDGFIVPVFMLTLLVISASVSGALIFGRPVLWYLDGAKREAVTLFAATVLWLVIFVLAVMIVVLAV